MSFKIRPVETEGREEVWHWLVYEDLNADFLRNGHVAGDREKAERAARAAIALIGGVVRENEEDDA